MLQTYSGSCHCGAASSEADIDGALGPNTSNGSICTKARNWNVIVMPEAFRLRTDATLLSNDQFNQRVGHHYLCSKRGVRSFARGQAAEVGGDYVAVQLSGLDEVNALELTAAPVRNVEVRHNNWNNPPARYKHL